MVIAMYRYFFKHPWRLTFAVIISIIAAGVLVAYSYVLQLITDIATGASHLSFALAVPAVLGYLVVQALTDGAAEYMNESLPARIGRELRTALFARYNRLRPLHFHQQQVGTYVAQLTKQVDVVTGSYFHVLLRAVYLVSLLVLAVLGTFLINPLITVGVALLSVPALVFPFLVKKWLESAQTAVVDAVAHYTSVVTDMLAGFTTIQYALSVPPFTRKHERVSQNVVQATVRDQKIQKITSGISDFLGDVMYLGAWLLGAYFVRRGAITLGQLVAFSQLASLFNWPMAMLTELLAEFYGGRKQAAVLAEVLAAPDDGELVSAAVHAAPDVPKAPFLALQNVQYHADGQNLLQDVNLQFESGKKYLVVGASGSGKTTLMRMLLGDLVPTSGRALLRGQDETSIDRGTVYATLGMMTQKPDIFAGTVRQNVTLFADAPSDAAVVAALTRAGLAEWLDQHSLDTAISAETPLLSGGEKQRLALARLFLRQYQFMIFDELTTGLDPRIAAQLQADLFDLPQGFILITHQFDAATFARADAIIVIAGGRVVANGQYADAQVQQELQALNFN
ncbi:abc transporter atp-binding and membrane spanning permease [Lacticaseibacillus sharpeae JCM 1186 = DSM 20505]|uniref:Abc transporter atp-binding and membrane spanning permease n=2 Tax=Lacticaseibacillus sharpeae TaxID=1626 RepID=A0A0R1ZKQ6_9LACO|nr:abc transporter atp-binding and membrane spanning permease [Lacticaseibacillus sharpeae JCM 1186 = DSM 20505]